MVRFIPVLLLAVLLSLSGAGSAVAHPVGSIQHAQQAITLGQLTSQPSLYDASAARVDTSGIAPINVRAQLLRVRKGPGIQLEPGQILDDQTAVFAVVQQTSGQQLPFVFRVYMTAGTTSLSDFQPGQQWQLQLRQRRGTQQQQFMLVQRLHPPQLINDMPLFSPQLAPVTASDMLCNNMLHHNCPDDVPPVTAASTGEDTPPEQGDVPSPDGEYHPEYNNIPPKTSGGGGASAAWANTYGGPDVLWYGYDTDAKHQYWVHHRTRSYRLLDGSHLDIGRQFGRIATQQWGRGTGLRVAYTPVTPALKNKKGYNLTMTDGRYGDTDWGGLAVARGFKFVDGRWTIELTKIYINRSWVGKYIRKGKNGPIGDGTPHGQDDYWWLQATICQEIGHGLGLGHGMGDCMAHGYYKSWAIQPGGRSRALLRKNNRYR